MRGKSWNTECKAPDCDRKAHNLGYCAMHYQRVRNRGTTEKYRRGIDYRGKRFGKLLAIRETPLRNSSRAIIWTFVCDCGNAVNRPVTSIVKSLQKGNVPCCPDCHSGRLPKGEANKRAVIAAYKENAARRGISFYLTDAELDSLFEGHCHYCGAEPSNTKRKRKLNGDFVYQGIDRVDNNVGYMAGNCVPCCDQCNWAKRDMSYEDFLKWVKRVADWRGEHV